MVSIEMPKCKHAVHALLRVLDRIRQELRGGMLCSHILVAVEEGLLGHFPCASCEENMIEFRREFVPLNDTVLPGDANESYIRTARRHGIKPTGS